MDWVDEMCPLYIVLHLIDELYWQLYVRISAHLIVKTLILLFFQLDVVSICGVFFKVSPFLNLALSLTQDQQSTNHPAGHYNDITLTGCIDGIWCSKQLKVPQREDNRSRKEADKERLKHEGLKSVFEITINSKYFH